MIRAQQEEREASGRQLARRLRWKDFIKLCGRAVFVTGDLGENSCWRGGPEFDEHGPYGGDLRMCIDPSLHRRQG